MDIFQVLCLASIILGMVFFLLYIVALVREFFSYTSNDKRQEKAIEAMRKKNGDD